MMKHCWWLTHQTHWGCCCRALKLGLHCQCTESWSFRQWRENNCSLFFVCFCKVQSKMKGKCCLMSWAPWEVMGEGFLYQNWCWEVALQLMFQFLLGQWISWPAFARSVMSCCLGNLWWAGGLQLLWGYMKMAAIFCPDPEFLYPSHPRKSLAIMILMYWRGRWSLECGDVYIIPGLAYIYCIFFCCG